MPTGNIGFYLSAITISFCSSTLYHVAYTINSSIADIVLPKGLFLLIEYMENIPILGIMIIN